MAGSVIILAVDGGGIRGIIPAYILNLIEGSLQKPCYQIFNMIGGTSTGGIIAAGLSTPQWVNDAYSDPLTAADLFNIYANDGADIFVLQDSWDFSSEWAKYYANYQGTGIEPFLQRQVGPSTTLLDAKIAMSGFSNVRLQHMFTTGYAVNSTGGSFADPQAGIDYGPYLFNWADADNSGDNYFVWEAARGTSAAPSYFPVAQVGGTNGYNSNANPRWIVDGGTMSNNPALWGVTEALRTGMASSLADITVISLGTGFYPGAAGVDITDNSGDIPGNWGAFPWVLSDLYDLSYNANRGTLLNIILDAVQNVAAAQLTAMINGGLTYYRLEPQLAFSQSAMDDYSTANIKSLVDTTKSYLKNDGNAIYQSIINLLKASF